MEETPICPVADQRLGEFIQASEWETSHHRMCKQEKKCAFGLQGVCCKLCSNGPCRIVKPGDRGVCGATADVIVARNFLRAVSAGSASYLHLTEQAALRLKKTAEERRPIRGEKALERLSKLFGIQSGDYAHRAGKIADAVLKDISAGTAEEMALWQALAPKERRERWKELGLCPGGAKSEILDGIVKSGTNLGSDPVDMMLHSLRLGVATGYYGLQLTNTMNDVMLGEPSIHTSPNGFGVIDPESVNILVTGHQISLFRPLMEEIEKKGDAWAKQAGAKKIAIVGCTCVGQDMRAHCPVENGGFCGYAGNNFASEPILATGCIDLVLSEFNCTLPGLNDLCEKQGVAQICLDAVSKTAGARLPQGDETSQVREILTAAVEGFRKRSAAGVQGHSMTQHGSAASVTGISEYSLKAFFGGSWEQLIRLIKAGAIRGVAAVVGCSNLRTLGHDVLTVELTKRLIAQDVLVLSAGCTSGGLMNDGLMNLDAAELAGPGLKRVCQALHIPPVLDAGSCLGIGRIETIAGEIAQELKVSIPELPFVVSAPQWLEEQALADGAFALVLGFTLHLGIPPFIMGSPLVTDILTGQMEQLTGGRVLVEQDPDAAASALIDVIGKKRSGLGLGAG